MKTLPIRRLSSILLLSSAVVALPKGLLLDSCLMVTSPLYPEAVHAVSVYVPEQYHDGDTACLYVGLDGVLCNAPAVFDNLIDAGSMPVAVGVFVQPGVVRDGSGKVMRYNRCYEFDAVTPRFAAFLEELVYDRIDGYKLPDGRTIRIARDGNRHAIFGASSGGIAALVSAWHRPDLFRRVFSAVGTFVAMRGGNELQAIIRKSEPRPLRVMLQDGTADAWNPLFGSWWEGNQLLASALHFNGIECRFDWGDTGHSIGRANEIFADAMRWLWQDYPEEIAAGRSQNDFLRSIEADTVGTQWVAGSYDAFSLDLKIAPQSVAYYPDSTLMAVSRHDLGNRIWQYIVQEGGTPIAGEPFYYLHRLEPDPLEVRCMTFDGDGNLWAVTSIGIQILDQNGRVRAILALPDGIESSQINFITIKEGEVALHSTSRIFTRQLKVKATSGSPVSQGQG